MLESPAKVITRANLAPHLWAIPREGTHTGLEATACDAAKRRQTSHGTSMETRGTLDGPKT